MSQFDSKEAILALGEIHPELKEFRLKIGDRPIPHLPAVVAGFKAKPPPPPPSSSIEYTKLIPMRDGYQSEIRIHQPAKESAATRGLFVLLHGGGFCLGNNFIQSYQSRMIATLLNLTVVNLSYRLAPDHKFPAAPHDVWDSLKWLTQKDHAQELGYDPEVGFYVGGTSAGANLSAVTTQLWLSEKCQPQINGVWICLPYFLEPDSVPEQYRHLYLAREQNTNTGMIDKEAVAFVQQVYSPDIFSPEFSPFQAENPHTGMPPVYIQVAGQDIFRDDALIYEKALREHGVKTRLDAYSGVPHEFTGMFRQLEIAKKCQMDMLAGITWLTGREVDLAQCEQLVEDLCKSPPEARPI